ncbi:MAG: DUF1206 domain-containing protein [Marinirhabdus sp.]|nr:DUF1206 domain-containing protein [Marinirhabdus sp.]
MSDKKEKFASFGIATKGAVYLIIGVLTAMAAFGAGGQKSGSGTVLEFLQEQSYGNVLLVLLAIGLLGYVFYRWSQAFGNITNVDDDTKGYVKRIAYFISGVLYGAFAYSAINIVIGSGSSSSSGSLSKMLFSSESAAIFAIIIGLALVGKGIYEFYQAYSGKFKDEVQGASIPHKAQSLLMRAGKIGYTARGIVAGILGYLFLKAGFAGNAQKLSKTDAFSYIQDEFGTVVMGLVAIGLAAYGVFKIIEAKYSSVTIRNA